MLGHEQAQARLAPFEILDLDKQRLKRVEALPAQAAFIGRTLLGVDDNGVSLDWQKQRAVTDKARAALPKLSARDRRLLLAALFPRLGDTVESAWKLFERLPTRPAACAAPSAPRTTRRPLAASDSMVPACTTCVEPSSPERSENFHFVPSVVCPFCTPIPPVIEGCAPLFSPFVDAPTWERTAAWAPSTYPVIVMAAVPDALASNPAKTISTITRSRIAVWDVPAPTL